MTCAFDEPIERLNTGCLKWGTYGEEVLPMWVADMDFRSPEPVVQALLRRVEHGVFGYAQPTVELATVICERMDRLYKWAVTPDQIVFLPGIVSAINLACRAFGESGDGVLVQTPVYPPFLSAPSNHSLTLQTAPLIPIVQGRTIRYEIDYDAFEAAITPRTRLFILCHPHNPTGCEYTPEQLTRLAETCLGNRVIIISDEIHCDLLLGGTRHIPTASLEPEIAENCITLMAPSKTFNIPGLNCAFAIIPNAGHKRRLVQAGEGIIPTMNALGLTAALAAYRDGEAWLAELVKYLTVNRDLLVEYVGKFHSPIRTTTPQATYLAWLDCREAGLAGSPYEFFLHKAKVALSDGVPFGPGGQGFVRLNFGCPRPQLVEALERMNAALSDTGSL